MSGTIIQHRFLREDARVAMDTMLGHEQSKAVHLTPRRMGGLESGQIGVTSEDVTDERETFSKIRARQSVRNHESLLCHQVAGGRRWTVRP